MYEIKQDGGVQSMRVPMNGKTTDYTDYRNLIDFWLFTFGRSKMRENDFRCVNRINPRRNTYTVKNIQNPNT